MTLTAYHQYTVDGLVLDLEVGNKNYNYVFKVTPEMLNILKEEFPSITICNKDDPNPWFIADVSGCRSAIQQLTRMMLETWGSKMLNGIVDE